VQKIERGSRPLKLEEAQAIAELLGVDLTMLTQYVDDEAAAAAIAQIQRSNAIEDAYLRQVERHRREREESDRRNSEYLKRVRRVKQEAEDRLREAGGHQDEQGRWWWKGEPVALEVSPVILMAETSSFIAGVVTDSAGLTDAAAVEKNPDGER
jgi:transcriptional regulator with XRE-family HTH domain